MRYVSALVPLLALITVTFGCDPVGSRTETAAVGEVPVHIDSVFPIEEELRRFRTSLGAPVSKLQGGATSRDELVGSFVVALEGEDVATLRSLALTPQEFVYLYYPTTRYTRPPYEMSPALVWFQLENYGSRGLERALHRHGGEPLGAIGYDCPDEPVTEGRNRIWSECTVRRLNATGAAVDLSLFGAILEREGHYKFVNYGNRL